MKDSVQEQLIAARRNQILDAAAIIFAEKGFRATTTKDIAKAADIAEGTIYNYFANKTALLFGIFERMKEMTLQGADFSQLAGADLRTFMRIYFHHPLMALKADNFALFRVVISEMMVNEELRTLYNQQILEPTITLGEQLFRQWAEQRMVKPIDISLTMRVIAGMMMGLMLEYTIGDKTLEAKWDALPDFLANLLLDGLASDPT